MLDAATIGDIRDLAALHSAMRDAEPQIVVHMAAQSIVRVSYTEPVETYATNVMGTVHVLEAVRRIGSVVAVVNVTSDKCYENREWQRAYCEDNPMGGHDPYSSSKGCAELVTSAYQRSYFGNGGVSLASARAGNVIGGGDWAVDRLVPDFFRAVDAGEPMTIRSPDAARPWQHVMEPLSGYLLLAENLFRHGDRFAGGWNFGPQDGDAWTVRQIVDFLTRDGGTVVVSDSAQPHEAKTLKLDSSKARRQLGWAPRWPTEKALEMTGQWYKAWRNGDDMQRVTLDQIEAYCASRDG
jgi:CDP-glucose 4,6-dehydratase